MANKVIIDLEGYLRKISVSDSAAKQAFASIGSSFAGEAQKTINQLTALLPKLSKSAQGALSPLINDLNKVTKTYLDLATAKKRIADASVENRAVSAETRYAAAIRASSQELNNKARQEERLAQLQERQAQQRFSTLKRETSARLANQISGLDKILGRDDVTEPVRRAATQRLLDLRRQLDATQRAAFDPTNATQRATLTNRGAGSTTQTILDTQRVQQESDKASIIATKQVNREKKEESRLEQAIAIDKKRNLDRALQLLEIEKKTNDLIAERAALESRRSGRNVSASPITYNGQQLLTQVAQIDPQALVQQAIRSRQGAIQQAFASEVQNLAATRGVSTQSAGTLLRRQINKEFGGDAGARLGVGSLQSFISTPAVDTSTLTTAKQSVRDLNKEVTVLRREGKVLTTDLNRQAKAFDEASFSANRFGDQIGLATRRFTAYLVGTAPIFLILGSFAKATQEALKFEKAQTRLSQILQKNRGDIVSVSQAAQKAAQATGTTATETLKGVDILAQAGFQNPDQLRQVSELFAKIPLTATFGSIPETSEGLIAIVQQFPQFNQNLLQTKDQLDLLSRAAADYAVEVKDIFEGVKRGGSVFAETGGRFEEFVELFTLLRSRTRESAESVGVFFKSIGLRLLQPSKVNLLEQLGISVNGKTLPSILKETSAVFNERFGGNLNGSNQALQLAQQLAGTQQGGRFLAILQAIRDDQGNFKNIISGASGSFDRETEKRVKDIGISFERIQQAVNTLLQNISGSNALRNTVKLLADLANGASNVLSIFKEIIPLIGVGLLAASTRGIGSAVTAVSRRFGAAGGQGRNILANTLFPVVGSVDPITGETIDILGRQRERFRRTGDRLPNATLRGLSGRLFSRRTFSTDLDRQIALSELDESLRRNRPITSLLADTRLFGKTDLSRNRFVRSLDRSRLIRAAGSPGAAIGLGAGAAIGQIIASNLSDPASSRVASNVSNTALVGSSLALASGPLAPIVLLGTVAASAAAGILTWRDELKKSTEELQRRKELSDIRTSGGNDLQSIINISRNRSGRSLNESFISRAFNAIGQAEDIKARSALEEFITLQSESGLGSTQIKRLGKRLVDSGFGNEEAISKINEAIIKSLGLDSAVIAKDSKAKLLNEQVNSFIKTIIETAFPTNFSDPVRRQKGILQRKLDKAAEEYVGSLTNLLQSSNTRQSIFNRSIDRIANAGAGLSTDLRSGGNLQLPRFRDNRDFFNFAASNSRLFGPSGKDLAGAAQNRIAFVEVANNLLRNNLTTEARTTIRELSNNKQERASTIGGLNDNILTAFARISQVTGLSDQDIAKVIDTGTLEDFFDKIQGNTTSLKLLNEAAEGITTTFNTLLTNISTINTSINTIRKSNFGLIDQIFGLDFEQRRSDVGLSSFLRSSPGTNNILQNINREEISTIPNLNPIDTTGLQSRLFTLQQQRAGGDISFELEKEIQDITDTLKRFDDNNARIEEFSRKRLELFSKNLELASQNLLTFKDKLVGIGRTDLPPISRRDAALFNTFNRDIQVAAGRSGGDITELFRQGFSGFKNFKTKDLQTLQGLTQNPIFSVVPFGQGTVGEQGNELIAIELALRQFDEIARRGVNLGVSRDQLEQKLRDLFDEQRKAKDEEKTARDKLITVINNQITSNELQISLLEDNKKFFESLFTQLNDVLPSSSQKLSEAATIYNDATLKFNQAVDNFIQNRPGGNGQISQVEIGPITVSVEANNAILNSLKTEIKSEIANAVRRASLKAYGEALEISDESSNDSISTPSSSFKGGGLDTGGSVGGG